MKISSDEIRAMAAETLKRNGMHIVHELKQHENYDAHNLIALMEIFAGELLARLDPEPLQRSRTFVRDVLVNLLHQEPTDETVEQVAQRVLAAIRR